MEEEYNEEFGNNVPDLNVEENKEEETPSVEESLISILQKKMIEIEDLYEGQEEELNALAIEKQELNSREEAVKYELSGLHGAKVVLQQLIEEAKDS
jgi:predicted  nucleic acid-binding Zn-ribbon protein